MDSGKGARRASVCTLGSLFGYGGHLRLSVHCNDGHEHSACVRAPEWELVVDTLSQLRVAEGSPMVCYSAATVSFDAAISACEIASEWKDLSLQKAAESDVQRTPFSACGKAYENASEWTSALDLLSQQAAGGVHCASSCSHIAAISACEKAFERTSALDMVSRRAAGGRNEKAFALDLLTEMRCDVVKPIGFAGGSYNAAISACENASEWNVALDLLSEMRDDVVKSTMDSHTAAIN